MTSSATPGEAYPGEALALLRAIHAELGELRELRREFGPLLDAWRGGSGLLGMSRAARRARNGAHDDYPPGAPGAPAPGRIGPGIFGRAHPAPGPGD
jgi:hypothetical protein